MRIQSIILASLLVAGCASSQKRWARDISADQTPEKILDVSFVPQEKNMCGPSVLKMATTLSAPEYSLEEIKKMSFREKAQGTFQSDILSASRRMGLTPYRVNSSEQMWAQLREERPVIVFQNLGLSWAAAWHFSLVVGYNSAKDKIYLHTGTEPLQGIGINRFIATWERGGKWSYVVTKPSDIPSKASFEESLENAMLLEKIGHLPAAREVYTAMTNKFPERFESHLGLAQIYYFEKNLDAAIKESEIALIKSPDHPALLFNLSVLNFESGHLQKAQDLKQQTLARASSEERAVYEKRFSF